MVHVEVIATQELGDRSYLAHDGRVAVVVDPQRDIGRMEAALARLGVRCVVQQAQNREANQEPSRVVRAGQPENRLARRCGPGSTCSRSRYGLTSCSSAA